MDGVESLWHFPYGLLFSYLQGNRILLVKQFDGQKIQNCSHQYNLTNVYFVATNHVEIHVINNNNNIILIFHNKNEILILGIILMNNMNPLFKCDDKLEGTQ